MDNLTKNPGLQHVAEAIFLNLDYFNLATCAVVNEDWKKIQENPTFWFQKCKQSPKFLNAFAWKKLIQLTNRNSDFEEKLTPHLRYLYLNLSHAMFMTEEEFCPIFWLIRNCGDPSLDSTLGVKI